jgi:uncharacterized membrane protein HdeD (DUF308 family)
LSPADRGPLLLAAAVEVGLGVVALSIPRLGLDTLGVLIGVAFIVRGIVTALTGLAAWHLARVATE